MYIFIKIKFHRQASLSTRLLYIYAFDQYLWNSDIMTTLDTVLVNNWQLSFRQPIHMWQYKSIRDLIRFSLFKYLGMRVCILTTPPPPLIWGRYCGYIATRLFWPDNYEYANCRNTVSLAGDLAETYFVLFMTKFESCIIWKGFSMCSNDKCLTEIQFYANN